jgi:nucleoside-diphosphate-sugar epimerase
VLVPMLLKAGHDVIGADTDYYSRCTFAGDLAEIPTRKADVRDAPWSELDGCQAVIHLAGLSNDPLGDYRPALTEDINFRASVRLAQAAKRAGVERFLFASSCSNYGAAGDHFLTEAAAFNPVTPYGVSKVRVEGELTKLADERFSPIYLRASTAYGLSPRIRFDLVVNNLTAWAFTTGRVYLKSDGSPWRPIVHVEDICRAYIAALQAPRELVHDVPGCRVEYAQDAGPDKRCYRVDCNKIARTLHDFKPQWTARRGVEQLYLAYKSIGLKLEDFEGPRFMRIAHVRKLVAEGLLDLDLRWRVPAQAANA